MEIREMRQKRAGLVKQAGELLTAAAEAKRELTTEEETRFNALHTEADKIKVQVDQAERQQDAELELAKKTTERADKEGKNVHDVEGEDDELRQAFNGYLRFGMNGLEPEQRKLLAGRSQNLSKSEQAQMRALSAGTGSSGGFTVPQGFYDKLIDAQKLWGGMRQAPCTVLSTGEGNDIPMALDDDTANVAVILAENVAAAEQDVVFTQKTIKAYMYTSKIVRVSFQLLQDSAFDVEAFLRDKFAQRMGRGTNAHFTTGTGTGQPQGVVTGAALGKTGLVGQTLTLIYADLVDLEHSVDPAYRSRDRARFMMHDSSLKVIKKLVDSQQRPLWVPGIAVREPDTILGYSYVINQDVAVMAANAKSVLFGDFSTYIIRDVTGGTVLRLEERYADFLQVGFLNFERHDGLLADAGTNPIKYYANSAT